MAGLFSEILDKSSEEVKRPPTAPVGTYILINPKLPVISDENAPVRAGDGREWDTITFNMQVLSVVEADPDEVAAYGDVKNIFVRKQFMFPRNDAAGIAKTEFQLKEFLTTHLGLGEGKIKELMHKSVGAKCMGQLAPRQDKNDPNIWYDDLKRTAPIE